MEQHKGLVYLGLDWQKWVYSHAMRGWVQNVQVDLMQISNFDLWKLVEDEVQKVAGKPVEVEVVLMAMSPDCRTFTKIDSSNVTRGNNYRLHGKGDTRDERPPKDEHSEKGKAAHEADRMVQKAIGLSTYMSVLYDYMGFYMENPVGSLWKRPYMVDWESWGTVRRHEVHYCAYKHWYHKPTHIWTNMLAWVPKGTTGTGQCEMRCTMGARTESGRWAHRYKLAQGSHLAKGGRGRKARKNMMPRGLHRELLQEAIRIATERVDSDASYEF